MSESGGRRSQAKRDRLREPGENGESTEQIKLLAGRISAVVGMLFAVGGVGGVAGSILVGGASVSAGTVGMILGILAYFLNARRIGTITAILSLAAVFFGLAASQGLIPGIEASDRGLPPIEPDAGEN